MVKMYGVSLRAALAITRARVPVTRRVKGDVRRPANVTGRALSDAGHAAVLASVCPRRIGKFCHPGRVSALSGRFLWMPRDQSPVIAGNDSNHDHALLHNLLPARIASLALAVICERIRHAAHYRHQGTAIHHLSD